MINLLNEYIMASFPDSVVLRLCLRNEGILYCFSIPDTGLVFDPEQQI